MPTYVYRCNGCGYEFEKFQKFSEDPIKVCPVCGKDTRRVFQPAGVVFKGSGWYITDSRKSDSKPDGKTEAKPAATASSETKSDSDSKTETKDAPKTETKDAPKTETSSETKPAPKDNAAA